jgi:exportin-1
MIIIDMESFPDHRTAFFEFIKAIGESFVSCIAQIPMERLKVILDAIIWAGKHRHPGMSELGLKALESLLVNIARNQQFSATFHQNFYIYTITEIFAIMTDCLHLSTFKYQSRVLRFLIE